MNMGTEGLKNKEVFRLGYVKVLETVFLNDLYTVYLYF